MALVALLVAASEPRRNLALGRPYTLEPAPNYTSKPDPGDARQLTDGLAARGNFWGSEDSSDWPSVGWRRAKPVAITIDLGAVKAIGGASFRTAAGAAGVVWPAAIYVVASEDGRSWYELGELVSLSARRSPPPERGFAVHRFASDQLVGRGRYVRFLVDDGPGPFVFADEIEVFEGDASAAAAWEGRRVAAGAGGEVYFARARTREGVQRALQRDLAAARHRLADASLDEALRRTLSERIAAAEAAARELPEPNLTTFRAVLPMNDVQATAFAVLGAIEQAAGKPRLTAAAADPWAPLAPDAPVSGPPGRVEIAAANGEVRARAIDLRVAGEEPLAVELSIAGLPEAADASVLSVEFTETAAGFPVATALVPAAREGGVHRIAVPAGMTRQVWLSFAPRGAPPGRHEGNVVLRAEGRSIAIPIVLRVFREDATASRLHVGGWDDTDSDDHYGLTRRNVRPLVEHLRARGVDSPWGMAPALAFPRFDANGFVSAAPDTIRFDRWLTRWPGARRYLVFVNAGDEIGGIRRGSAFFDAAVASWLGFWADHARKQGVRPEQIGLLLVDEPHTAEQADRVAAWGRAVRKAGSGIRVWQNASWEDPAQIPSAFLSVTDDLCANRLLGKRGGASYWEFFADQREAGRDVEIYGAEGPAHQLDPYAYYRLQAWHAAAIGAKGIHFWAFADTGGASSWNDFATTRDGYTPLFLSADAVGGSKHMEAIREGAQDYELLARLRERVAEVSRTHPEHSALENARRLTRDAAGKVLGAEGADAFSWSEPKDRRLAEAVRIQVAEALDALRPAER